MLIPIVPTAAFLGFAGFAGMYGLRKQWKNAVICLLCGAMAFLLLYPSAGTSHELDRERARITALEQRVRTLEEQLQRIQAPSDKK